MLLKIWTRMAVIFGMTVALGLSVAVAEETRAINWGNDEPISMDSAIQKAEKTKGAPAVTPEISNPQGEAIASLVRRFRDAILRKDEKQEAEAAQALLALDTDKMPEEWRHAVVNEQLETCNWIGDWKKMVSIKDKLMNKKRKSKTDDLCDADLLIKINGYYSGNPIFNPPREMQKRDNSDESFEFDRKYARRNYYDAKEGERILRYIVNTFDPYYAPAFHARILLAGILLNLGKPAESMAVYLKCDEQDVSKLYCLPKANIFTGKIISGKDVMNEYYTPEFIEDEQVSNRSEMLRVSISLEHGDGPDIAIENLRALRKRHLNNQELREKLEARLRELSLKSDLIIPAEELGLPKITSKTVATSSTLPAAKPK